MSIRKHVLVSLPKEKTRFCLSWRPKNLFTCVILCKSHPSHTWGHGGQFLKMDKNRSQDYWRPCNCRARHGAEPYKCPHRWSGKDIEADNIPSDILDMGFSRSMNNVSTLKSSAATGSLKPSDEHTNVRVY